MTENDAKIVVIVPQDRAVRELIDLTAKFVAIDGDPFEQVSSMVYHVGCPVCVSPDEDNVCTRWPCWDLSVPARHSNNVE